MLRGGYATYRPDTKSTTHDLALEKAQKDAKALGKGLWGSVCENTRDESCTIKANYRKQTRTRIYHLPGYEGY